jgi:nucleoid DNA-binding protein
MQNKGTVNAHRFAVYICRMLMAECIAALLMEQDAVVLPGFGSFRTEVVSAMIHPGENSFHPPSKKVYFDHSVTAEDHSIEKWLTEHGGLSAAEAGEVLRNFLRELMSSLKDKGGYELDGIGRFYYDIERQLQFSPQPGRNFLIDSFGLPEFVSSPVLRRENITAYSAQKPAEEKKKRRFIWFRL